MKSTLSYLLIICSLFTACIGHQEESLLFYVDTRTGTAPSATHTAELFGKNTEEYGQTLPAVLEPNGMNFWTPQTQDIESKAYVVPRHLVLSRRNSNARLLLCPSQRLFHLCRNDRTFPFSHFPIHL